MIYPAPLSVDSCAWFPYSEKLFKSLARESRFEEPYNMATVVALISAEYQSLPPHTIGVPREMVPDWKGTPLDKRSVGKPLHMGPCTYQPRNKEQTQVILQSVGLLHNDQSHIVEASTGFGKTFCALNIAAQMKVKTLIVVTKEDLLTSWPKEVAKFFPQVTKVGVIQQNKCETDCNIVVAMVHSLAQREYDFDRSEFGLIIFDEVHHMAAETFSRVAAMFPAKYRLGFSATPQRSDGKDPVFHGHIGKVMVKAKLIPMPPKVLIKRTGWKLPRVMRRDSHGNLTRVQLPHEAGKLMHVYVAMAQDGVRNNLIAQIAVQAYNKGRWAIVMSELAEDKHLGILREICKQMGVPDGEMAYYKGGMKKADLEIAKTKRLVFCTYGMTSEATDVPWWDLAILATPRANVMQAAGRVLREHPGKPQPVIIDLVDDDSAILEGYYKARLKQYTGSEMKGTVIHL
jgi:hypothetical protein